VNIEHVALNVADPVALADWYVKHLGMKIIRQVDGPPHTRFIADAAGRTVLEVYRQQATVPDYASQDPMVLHVAFVTTDIRGVRERLLAAGATVAKDIHTTPDGDEMAFLRDPWGVVIQLVKRARPLLPEGR
jgi:catechol 2,3-dioxygenase-like lactoylglutathione lyase family enzyme